MENVEVADLSKLTFIRDEQTKTLEEAIGSSIGIDWNALFPSQTQFMTRFDALEETKNNRGFLLANPFQSQLESDGLKEVSVVNNGIPLSLSLYCIWNKTNESIDVKLLSN